MVALLTLAPDAASTAVLAAGTEVDMRGVSSYNFVLPQSFTNATAGSVQIAGYRAGDMSARRLVGASLSQERSFYLRLSGRTNLLFFARMRYDDRREGVRSVDALIEELELADIAAQRVDRCSTGMVQQLALARALLGDPVVLLLDEPTRSLDADARARLWGALQRRPQAAALIATHLDEDVKLCDERVSFPV